MKINQKKIIILSIVIIPFIGLIGIGLSYSYYLTNININNKDNKTSDITTTSITEVVMDMQGKVAVSNAYPGHKAVKEVVVRGIGDTNSIPANVSIKITPDLGVFTGDITWKLYKSEDSISCNNTLQVTDSGAYEEATCTIPSSATLELEGSSTSLYKNIVISPNSETKYYLVVEYLNKEDEDQSSQMNNTFSIDISLNEKVPNFAESITNLSNDDKVNFATDDPDSNIRYIGKNPDNYVYFNCSDYNNQSDSTCEKWRIIGVFNNITKSDGTKENLVKIIRDERLNNIDLRWDYKQTSVGTSTATYGSNDWTDSQLMMMLNSIDYLKFGYTNSSDIISSGGQQIYSRMGSYYNGTKGCKPVSVSSGAKFNCTEIDFTSTGLKNDTTRNTIEEVVWNLGGVSPSIWYPTEFYTEERGTTVYSERQPTWTGKIGLMYPSDYGYATSGSSRVSRTTCLVKGLSKWGDLSDCYNNNYLYKSDYHQWTLTSYSKRSDIIFYIILNGNVGSVETYVSLGTRPTIYLKSNISINSGTGSSDNPYKLNL